MRVRIVFTLALIAIAFAAPANAGNLGVANSYNEFSFGDSSRSNVDSEGRVAVGGNATFDNFTVGSSLSGSGYALIVGGNLGGTQTVIQGGGNASYNSISGGTNLYFNDGGSGIQQSSPIDFASAESYLKSLSSTLENTTANGTTSTNPEGYLTLTGTSSTLDVFNVTAAQLSGAAGQGLTISVPSTATVVVNIAGTSDTMENFSTTLSNGLPETQVLYNFYQATSLTISGIGIEGSVLAPYADIDFAGGQINGTLIGDEINGSGESHNDPFDGNLPNAVPEPSSVVMMLTAGAFGLVGLARRRNRRRTA